MVRLPLEHAAKCQGIHPSIHPSVNNNIINLIKSKEALIVTYLFYPLQNDESLPCEAGIHIHCLLRTESYEVKTKWSKAGGHATCEACVCMTSSDAKSRLVPTLKDSK